MTDRVRQSLFDRLTVMQMLGGHVLDLFAGTGSLGLESLSRGADHCTFVERDTTARRVLEQNVADLELADQATVLAANALRPAWIDLIDGGPVRLVYCDPPYRDTADAHGATRVARLIDSLAPVVEEDSLLVLRTEARIGPPPTGPQWQGPESHRYGSMTLHFYRSQGGESTSA